MRTTDDMTQAAMATWAAKDLSARLLAAQVAKLLNCSTEDISILVSS
jgi:DNA-binding XRE family transcriptional regulator